MTQIDDLLAVARAYAAATGLAESTVSRRFLGAGSRVGRLMAGGDIGAQTIARAMAHFSREWPEGAVWPDGVERPEPPAAFAGAERGAWEGAR